MSWGRRGPSTEIRLCARAYDGCSLLPAAPLHPLTEQLQQEAALDGAVPSTDKEHQPGEAGRTAQAFSCLAGVGSERPAWASPRRGRHLLGLAAGRPFGRVFHRSSRAWPGRTSTTLEAHEEITDGRGTVLDPLVLGSRPRCRRAVTPAAAGATAEAVQRGELSDRHAAAGRDDGEQVGGTDDVVAHSSGRGTTRLPWAGQRGRCLRYRRTRGRSADVRNLPQQRKSEAYLTLR
jgi:hypothetical protein